MVVAVVKARNNEPKIAKKIVDAEAEYATINLMVDVDVTPTSERMRRPVGSVRFVNRRNEVIAFMVRSANLLVVDPAVPDNVVAKIAKKAEYFAVARMGFTSMVLRSLRLAAAIAAAAGLEGFKATPESAELCGVAVTRENINELLASGEWRRIEKCLEDAIKKLMGGSVRVAGMDIV